MSPGTARALRVLFYAYVAATFVHLAFVVNHEPFSFDAWNVSNDTGAKPFSVGRFFEFWHQQYTTSNPRIGQPLAYLAYKLVGVAELGTPLAFFAIVLAGFVLGTGRWPSRKNDRDLATLAIGIGAMWFVAPNMPAYMFCRAYATNYIWAIAIQLWFLVPLRLYGSAAERTTIPKLVAYFVFAVAAGMCNEHTGPTLVAFTFVYAVWQWRKHGRRSLLVWAGVLGALAGFVVIFFAPGQSQRYEGVAEHYSAYQQVLVRGFAGNIDIYLNLLQAAAPLLLVAVAAVAIGMITESRPDPELAAIRDQQRRALVFVGITILAASTITITVFASPKLGPRFYLHATLLMFAGLLGIVQAFLHRARALAPFVIFAAIASGYAVARTVPTYLRLSRASDQRLAALAATPRGGALTLEAWDPVNESWWTMGDDARDQGKDVLIAKYFDLDRVLFRGGDHWKPLGLTDVKLTMHYELDTPMCLDELDELDIKPWMGTDVGAIHHAFLDAITEIQRVSGTHIKTIDLTATFLGSDPPLPRKKLYVARWVAGVFEGYTANIKRTGRSAKRQLVLSPALKTSDWDIYAIRIGDEPRKLGLSTSTTPLAYEPWTTGNYWVTACKADYCFVLFSTTHVVL
jgi:hypothetical protein